MICENIKNILQRIERAKDRAGQKNSVELVAVTKTVPVDKIKEAILCGITVIGENRIQEAEEKFVQLPTPEKIKKHLIGHLQTNKVKKAVEIFDLIQSVDSVRLLCEINKRAENIGKIQDCLVEIKVSEEETKSGLEPSDLEFFFDKARELKNVKISGVMAIAPYFENPESARPYFKRAKEVFEQVHPRLVPPPSRSPLLSMGMTNDFEIAVEEGANVVRIGTGIFGERI